MAQELLVFSEQNEVSNVLAYFLTRTIIHMSAQSSFFAHILGLTFLTAFSGNTVGAVYNISDINALFTVPVYNEDFDSPANANWTPAQSANGAAVADSSVTYGYNYTAGGNVGPFTGVPAIASAPSQGGTSTRGVVLTAQDVDDAGTDAAQGIAIFAQNLPAAPTVPYAIRFDLWTNFISGTSVSTVS